MGLRFRGDDGSGLDPGLRRGDDMRTSDDASTEGVT